MKITPSHRRPRLTAIWAKPLLWFLDVAVAIFDDRPFWEAYRIERLESKMAWRSYVMEAGR